MMWTPGIECQIPIRLRLLGQPTEEDLARLEAAVARAVAARLAMAGGTHAGLIPAAGALPHTRATEAPYEPARDRPGEDAYELPSYQSPAAVRVPVRGPAQRPAAVPGAAAAAVALPRDGDDPINPLDYPAFGWWLLPEHYDARPSFAEAREVVGRWFPRLFPLLLDATPLAYRAGGYEYWALRHPTAGIVARVLVRVSGAWYTPPRDQYGVYLFMRNSEGQALWRIFRSVAEGQEAAQRGARPPVPRTFDPLLDEYFRLFPPQPGGAETSFLDHGMRIRLALALADRGFFGAVYDAAIGAISDRWFLAQTIGMITVYVGLWLAPDPATKALAGLLTVFLIALFTWHDIIGFGRAWFQLEDDSAAATTPEELRKAGNQFMRKLGQVGFDVFLMILFWGGARLARARLSSARARIASDARVRAEAQVVEASRAPGSGGARPSVTPAEFDALAGARTAAGPGATPTEVLNELAGRLREGPGEGLRAERARVGDARVLETLDARVRGGRDVFRWLEEQAQPEAARTGAAEALVEARARLVRARLIELRSLENNPTLQRTIRAEFLRSLENNPTLQRTIRAEFLRDLVDLGRALLPRNVRLRDAVRAHSVDAVVGEVGEALARGQLAADLPPGGGLDVLSSLELARRVPGYRTVAEWAAAERAAGREPPASRLGHMRQGPDGVYESVGQIDNAVAQRLPDDRLRILEIEEVKTGGETSAAARAQVIGARDALARIGEGASDVRVLERLTPAKVGRDVTGRLDLSRGDAVRAVTRGPEGRMGFDRSLGASRADLAAVAGRLIPEGLPPGPPTIRQLVQSSGEPRQREDPQQPPRPGAPEDGGVR